MRKDGNTVERTWMGNKNNPVLSCGGRRESWPHSCNHFGLFFSSWSLVENHQLYSHPQPHSPVHMCTLLGVRHKTLKLAFYLCIWTETVKRTQIFGAITQIGGLLVGWSHVTYHVQTVPRGPSNSHFQRGGQDAFIRLLPELSKGLWLYLCPIDGLTYLCI